MRNKIIKKTVTRQGNMVTGSIHQTVTIWIRYTYDKQAQLKPCYTVAIDNCIQANFEYNDLVSAEFLYSNIIQKLAA